MTTLPANAASAEQAVSHHFFTFLSKSLGWVPEVVALPKQAVVLLLEHFFYSNALFYDFSVVGFAALVLARFPPGAIGLIII